MATPDLPLTLAPPSSLGPLLDRLSDQAEAAASAQADLLPEGTDGMPEVERAAWRRVLMGFAKSEGFEEWVMAPTAEGLASCGFGDPAVLRFFRLQGEDELRHERLFRTYLARHFGEVVSDTGVGHRIVYDGFLKSVVTRSARKPLRLLLPLLVFEKTGTLYLRRLLASAGADKPRLNALVGAIFRDEARHVAGVGATCRALVAVDPPGRLERAVLRGVCRLVVMDMDRKAWWKPGLEAHVRALGVDPEAMNADNERIYREVCRVIDGAGVEADDAGYAAPPVSAS